MGKAALPIMQVQPVIRNVEERPASLGIGTSKVLVVDDESAIIEALVELLTDEGFSSLSAQSPHRAIEMVQNDPEIGIVVTDIRMPGMDGLEMARRMKAAAGPTRDLFIIVVTGHAGMSEAVEALKLGAEDFLAKPISPDHLLHSVHRAVEMVRLRHTDRNFKEQMQCEVQAKTADLNEANRKLAVASQMKDQFLSVMGHELRTPLNAINGFTELLKAKLHNADGSVSDYLEHILTSGHRLSAAIENILEYSAAISGGRAARVDVHNAAELLRTVMDQLHHQAVERGVALQLVALPQLPTDRLVEVDGAMVIKALTCLIENAIKFSRPGTKVAMGMERQQGAVTFFVKDQGCGMTAAEIKRARQPLSQVDSSLTRPVEGVGLGLSLAVLLSELQGGTLDIDSAPQQGTTVRMTLPQRHITG